MTNPRVLVEVTSNGTEDYDRGEKLKHHKQLPTVDTVVLVSHREPRVEVGSKAADGASWSSAVAGPGREAKLLALS